MTKGRLKLGTRKSLLAWAQSGWVAREVERLNPGVSVELVGIETRGDKIQNVSLQSVQGKEFFVAELDDCLREGQVDFTVHSMKDLSLDRPSEFRLAAIPKRVNPRDVILFGPNVMEKLRKGRKLRIGTSSPRRLENIPAFLKQALPQIGEHLAPSIEFLEIRGNVNTRLSRVHESQDSERNLDAVVLAFAGLIRLWQDPEGKKELCGLLKGVKWMILPLSASPAAPAQGALAIECRADDEKVSGILSALHDPFTEKQVSRERDLLARWGGGCHQKFGATAVEHPECGELFYVRGKKPDQAFVNDFNWSSPPKPEAGEIWDGNFWRAREADSAEIEKSSGPYIQAEDQAVFVAHFRAVRSPRVIAKSRVWTSGIMSWFKLAEKGVWVEGCAEGLGFDFLKATLGEAVLNLPSLNSWTILTHQAAQRAWGEAKVVATYEVSNRYEASAQEALKRAKHVFWSSGSQFDALKEWMPRESVVACGAGKTSQHLRANGITPLVFPSVEEWRKWLKT